MPNAYTIDSLRRKGRAADEYLTNLSIGGGDFLTSQLEGMQQIAQHPIETGKALVEGGREFLADPKGKLKEGVQARVDALRSGPIGVGRTLAEFMPLPRTGSVGKMGMTAAEKAAATRAAKVAENTGVRHREALRAGGKTDVEQLWTPGENRIVSPEALQGRVLVPIIGDNARTGARINTLRGAPLEGGVNVQGGPRYSQQHAEAGSPAGWAANISAARAAQNDLIKASDVTGKPAIGIYTMMHPETSQNFSVPIADITAKALPSMRVSPKVVSSFDKEVRALFPEFTSITDPALSELIRQPGMGDLRKKIAETAAKKQYQNEGFPLTSDILEATTEPMLKGAPTGHTGLTMFESAPDSPLILKDEAVLPHETYPVGIPGKWMGGLASAGPLEQVLPQVHAQQVARGRTEPGKQLRSISMSHGNYQLADQEWVDRQMALAEMLRRSQP
jgi:hypothetical protein